MRKIYRIMCEEFKLTWYYKVYKWITKRIGGVRNESKGKDKGKDN